MMWWVNLLSALLGGLLGGGGAIVTQIVRHRLDDGRTRRALAGAFAGEVAAICAIARRRDYLGAMTQLHEHVRHSGQPRRLVLSITQDYFQIYRSNAGALGLLPAATAEQVALFYTQTKSLIEDVLPTAPNPQDAATAEQTLQEQIALLQDTLQLGDELVKQLREVGS